MRGQISYIEPIFTLLLAGILAGVVAVILPGQVTQVTPDIDAKEFENRALLLTNSLLANPNLIYSNNRAMLDESDLNTGLMDKSSNFDDITQVCDRKIRQQLPNLCVSSIYPDSFALVLVKDAEDSRGWFSFIQPDNIELENKLLSCFKSVNKNKVQELFDESKDILQTLGIKNCGFKRNSNVLNNGFPVSIRYPNGNVHIGWIKVLVVE